MPLRHSSSMQHQLHRNGVRLHAAMMSRIQSHGADDPPSDEELELMEERRKLKAERDERHDQALQSKPKAPKLAVRTTRAQPKPKEAKASKDQEAKAAKKAGKPHLTRTEKHAQKAAALDAARRATKKSAKT